MHTLSCSIDGLVIARHNEICDKILYLSQHDFTSSSVRAEPLIHQGRTRSEQDIRQGSDNHRDTRGGVMIQSLSNHQVDSIIDVKLEDADADTYKYDPMTLLLARWEKIKKDKHGKHCNDQRKLFLPFIISMDGMLWRSYLVVLSQLTLAMAEKREEPPFQVQGWVNRCIEIAVERSYSQMIRGAWLPSPLWEQEPEWDPESGIGLAG